jgi:hypothetical protein
LETAALFIQSKTGYQHVQVLFLKIILARLSVTGHAEKDGLIL